MVGSRGREPRLVRCSGHHRFEGSESRLPVAAVALRAGRLDEARQRLGDIAPTSLSAADREGFENLVTGLDRAEQRESLIQEHRRHLQDDDLLGARDAARALTLVTSGADRESWEQRCDQLRRQIQEAWRVEIEPTRLPLADMVGLSFLARKTPNIG